MVGMTETERVATENGGKNSYLTRTHMGKKQKEIKIVSTEVFVSLQFGIPFPPYSKVRSEWKVHRSTVDGESKWREVKLKKSEIVSSK